MNDTGRRTFRYRLVPTEEQERVLVLVLARCRALYNCALEQRRTWWARGQGRSATHVQQQAELPGLRAACSEYAEVSAQVLQDVMLRVDRAFLAFFQRTRAGETPGYPRFQRPGRYNSFTYPQIGAHGGAALDGGVLHLARIGRIPIRLHRPLQGTPKTVTISREADGWYACISCAEVPAEPMPLTGKETGIDVGSKVFLITADGDAVENPHCYRKAERGLKKAQKCVSRRKKGSKRWRKAVGRCAKKHLKVRRQRVDFHHKTALALIRQYDVIYLEDLQIRNLSRRHTAKPDGNGGHAHNGAARKAGLNKSINDAGWYNFRRILTCKAAWAGKRVEAIPSAYTSQDCSGCGERIPKSLSVRPHICTSCGLMLDRDENAARNILRAGQARQGAVAMAAVLN